MIIYNTLAITPVFQKNWFNSNSRKYNEAVYEKKKKNKKQKSQEFSSPFSLNLSIIGDVSENRHPESD